MTDIDIKFNLYANTPIIEPKIWSNRSKCFKVIDMLFDTGAGITTLSSPVAEMLGYKPIKDKKTTIESIGGGKSAGYIIIPNLKIGDFEFGAITAVVSDFSGNVSSHAILGMNVIKYFNTTIEFNENIELKGIITMRPRFNTDEIKTTENFNYEYSRFGLYNIRI